MVSGNGIETELRPHLSKEMFISGEILAAAVILQDIASDENDIWAAGIHFVDEFIQETIGRRFAQVQVGHEDDGYPFRRRFSSRNIDVISLDPESVVVEDPHGDKDNGDRRYQKEAPLFKSRRPHGLFGCDSEQAEKSNDEVG